MSSAIDPASKRNTHHLHHQWSGDESVSDKVVEAIADYEDEHRSSLPPLEHSINPEALDTAFGSPNGNPSKAGCITFSYYGYTVLVQSTGQILIKKR